MFWSSVCFAVSRNKDKLKQVATEIEESFDVKTKVIDIDFTKDRIAQRRIEAEIKDLDIGILINNVGVSYDYPEYFLQIGSLIIFLLTDIHRVCLSPCSRDLSNIRANLGSGQETTCEMCEGTHSG